MGCGLRVVGCELCVVGCAFQVVGCRLSVMGDGCWAIGGGSAPHPTPITNTARNPQPLTTHHKGMGSDGRRGGGGWVAWVVERTVPSQLAPCDAHRSLPCDVSGFSRSPLSSQPVWMLLLSPLMPWSCVICPLHCYKILQDSVG